VAEWLLGGWLVGSTSIRSSIPVNSLPKHYSSIHSLLYLTNDSVKRILVCCTVKSVVVDPCESVKGAIWGCHILV
jgi:hypothetical protein